MSNHLDELAYELEIRKAEEENARAARISAEQALIDAIGVKDEGTRTEKTDWYKISTIGKLNRKLDKDAHLSLDTDLYQAITRIKYELDVTALKKLATSNPEAYRQAIKAIITTEAKPTVKIERIEPTTQQQAA